jgi:hypothetical protein
MMTQNNGTNGANEFDASRERIAAMLLKIQECQAAIFALQMPLTWIDIINLQSAKKKEVEDAN